MRSLLALALSVSIFAACTKKAEPPVTISIDGSSTVYPITEAIAEEFGKANKSVRVTVGISGTGGGFKRFCAGETDINDASRPIKAEEAEAAKTHAIEYVEFPVAYDGLSVVVNKDNTWVDSMTVAELNKLWTADSKVKTWKDIRPSWPARQIFLFGPGTDSGTFDYFTEVINGKGGVSRSDYTKSEDDNTLVNGVKGHIDTLAYFGYAYYLENKDSLKLVPIKVDAKSPAVSPSPETIRDHSYKPLSRPVFIYVTKKALARPEVHSFVKFYLQTVEKIAKDVGFVAMPAEKYQAGLGLLN